MISVTNAIFSAASFRMLVPVLLILSFWGAEAGAGLFTLRLPGEATVAGDDIRLGDIAGIEYVPAEAGGGARAEAAAGEAESLSGVVVGRAPLPGRTRWIDRDYILLRLKQHGFDPARVTLAGPDRIEILRASVEVSKNEIEAMVLAFLAEQIESAGLDAEIGEIRGAKAVLLPTGRVSHTVEIPPHEDLSGNVRATIRFSVDGEPSRRISVYARIHRMVAAVTAARPMARGRVIAAEDVVLRKMDAADLSASTILRIEDAVGKVSRKRIDVQAVLRSDMLERPFLVERGDIVKIVARSEQIRIVTLGEVRKKGRADDRIQVLNLDSDQEVYARVIDANTVAVNF